MKWYGRALHIIAVLAVGTLLYHLVNHINGLRAATDLLNCRIFIDEWIPYLGWTWTVYYYGEIYIVFWAVYVLWLLPVNLFRRAIYVYIGMIVSQAIIQVLVPIQSPLPENLNVVQSSIHNLMHIGPYACFPSGHVTYTVLITYLAFRTLSRRGLKIFSVVSAALIIISTMTLKEHHAVDVFGGLIVAFLAAWIWRWEVKKQQDNDE